MRQNTTHLYFSKWCHDVYMKAQKVNYYSFFMTINFFRWKCLKSFYIVQNFNLINSTKGVSIIRKKIGKYLRGYETETREKHIVWFMNITTKVFWQNRLKKFHSTTTLLVYMMPMISSLLLSSLFKDEKKI